MLDEGVLGLGPFRSTFVRVMQLILVLPAMGLLAFRICPFGHEKVVLNATYGCNAAYKAVTLDVTELRKSHWVEYTMM